MFARETIYGLDIETLNDESRGYFGLDPSRSEITEIAVATDESINGGGEVFTGSEATILRDFATFLGSLTSGLVATWNGAFFDAPFLDYRAAQVLPGGIHDLGMMLRPEPSLVPKYDPLPTATTPGNPNGGWGAMFTAADDAMHTHLDVAQAWRRFADDHDVKWSLKPVCAAAGIEMFEIDRTRVHEYPEADQRRYVLSDASGARTLAMKTLGLDYTPYAGA